MKLSIAGTAESSSHRSIRINPNRASNSLFASLGYTSTRAATVNPEAVESELRDLKRSLIARRAKLTRLAAKPDAIAAPGHSEQMFEIQGDRTLSMLVEELDIMLTEVNAALDRLHRGAYGTCTRCHRQIEADRLRALPTTRTCASCAGALL